MEISGDNMARREFIKEYREVIDEVTKQHTKYKITNKDREEWILHDEFLYKLAKEKGVRV